MSYNVFTTESAMVSNVLLNCMGKPKAPQPGDFLFLKTP